MATHGHGWAKRMVLGSVADHVRHNTDVPLLLLKGGPGELSPAPQRSARPGLRRQHGARPRSILLVGVCEASKRSRRWLGQQPVCATDPGGRAGGSASRSSSACSCILFIGGSRGGGEVHREQQVLRHRLPRDVAVPRHVGEVDAQERRLRAVPHPARAGELRQDQARRLARGLGALHRRLEEADPGHPPHPQLRLRAQRLPHQRPDEQDDLKLGEPAPVTFQHGSAGPREAALHRLSRVAGARRRARRHRSAGELDAVVLHLPHRRHQGLLATATSRRTPTAARARTATASRAGPAARAAARTRAAR